MGFFDFITSWFKSDKAKIVLKLGTQILKMFVGDLSEKIIAIAKEEVATAEASGKDGLVKYKSAYDAIKYRLDVDIREFIINFAIELVVYAMNLAKTKK